MNQRDPITRTTRVARAEILLCTPVVLSVDELVDVHAMLGAARVSSVSSEHDTRVTIEIERTCPVNQTRGTLARELVDRSIESIRSILGLVVVYIETAPIVQDESVESVVSRVRLARSLNVD